MMNIAVAIDLLAISDINKNQFVTPATPAA